MSETFIIQIIYYSLNYKNLWIKKKEFLLQFNNWKEDSDLRDIDNDSIPCIFSITFSLSGEVYNAKNSYYKKILKIF